MPRIVKAPWAAKSIPKSNSFHARSVQTGLERRFITAHRLKSKGCTRLSRIPQVSSNTTAVIGPMVTGSPRKLTPCFLSRVEAQRAFLILDKYTGQLTLHGKLLPLFVARVYLALTVAA